MKTKKCCKLINMFVRFTIRLITFMVFCLTILFFRCNEPLKGGLHGETYQHYDAPCFFKQLLKLSFM